MKLLTHKRIVCEKWHQVLFIHFMLMFGFRTPWKQKKKTKFAYNEGIITKNTGLHASNVQMNWGILLGFYYKWIRTQVL